MTIEAVTTVFHAALSANIHSVRSLTKVCIKLFAIIDIIIIMAYSPVTNLT